MGPFALSHQLQARHKNPKMLKLAASSLFTSAFASFVQISEGLDAATANSSSLRSFSPNGGTWGFMGAALTSSINGYGCWCYFDSIGKGKSEPPDEIDGYCKTLQQGYECAAMDTAGCIPYEVTYQKPPSMFGLSDPSTVKTTCEGLNTGDQCAIDACAAETWFILNMMNANSVVNDANKHPSNGGTFDVSTSCPIQTGTSGDKTCCGDQPLRFAYKSFSGTRACCGSATYDTTIASCCDEGGTDVVRLVCN